MAPLVWWFEQDKPQCDNDLVFHCPEILGTILVDILATIQKTFAKATKFHLDEKREKNISIYNSTKMDHDIGTNNIIV